MPTFKCRVISDRFNEFGLMTADEVTYAGGLAGKTSPKSYGIHPESAGRGSGRRTFAGGDDGMGEERRCVNGRIWQMENIKNAVADPGGGPAAG